MKRIIVISIFGCFVLSIYGYALDCAQLFITPTGESWKVERLVYSPGGIQNAGFTDSNGNPITKDFFGNYPHWIYVIKNNDSLEIRYYGPQDIIREFPGHQSEIDSLRKSKKEELEIYQEKSRHINTARRVFGLALIEEKSIGDRHYTEIDQAYKETHNMLSLLSQEVTLEAFTGILGNLSKLGNYLQKKKLSSISEDTRIKLIAVLEKIKEGKALTHDEIQFLIRLHEDIITYLEAHDFSKERLSWGRRHAVSEDTLYRAKTPAYHANVWIAHWILKNFASRLHELTIIDIGANSSILFQVMNELNPRVAQNIIDFEKDPEIYRGAPNSMKVRGDIGILDEKTHLPRIEEASDDLAEQFVSTPHNFDIAIASFIYEQLEPREVRSSLIALENLLREPKEGDEPPILIIALPEHSPLIGSNLDRILTNNGYTPILVEALKKVSLTQEAKERIRNDHGNEALSILEEAVDKAFHIGVYRKEESADSTKLEKIKVSELTIREKVSSPKKNGKPQEERKVEFTIEKLRNLDLLAGLKAADFTTEAEGDGISIRSLVSDPVYADFEARLASLEYFRGHLTRADQTMLDSMVTLLKNQNTTYLTQTQVNFVMNKPTEITLKYSQAIEASTPIQRKLQFDYDQAYKDRRSEIITEVSEGRESAAIAKLGRELKNKAYSLWQLFEIEEEYRMKHDQASLVDEVRKKFSSYDFSAIEVGEIETFIDSETGALQIIIDNYGKGFRENNGARLSLEALIEHYDSTTRKDLQEVMNQQEFKARDGDTIKSGISHNGFKGPFYRYYLMWRRILKAAREKNPSIDPSKWYERKTAELLLEHLGVEPSIEKLVTEYRAQIDQFLNPETGALQIIINNYRKGFTTNNGARLSLKALIEHYDSTTKKDLQEVMNQQEFKAADGNTIKSGISNSGFKGPFYRYYLMWRRILKAAHEFDPFINPDEWHTRETAEKLLVYLKAQRK